MFTGRGGVLLENSKVTEIVPGPTVTLVTADKVIQADRVILAPGAAVDACMHAWAEMVAGGWAGPMFSKLGLEVCVVSYLCSFA